MYLKLEAGSLILQPFKKEDAIRIRDLANKKYEDVDMYGLLREEYRKSY